MGKDEAARVETTEIPLMEAMLRAGVACIVICELMRPKARQLDKELQKKECEQLADEIIDGMERMPYFQNLTRQHEEAEIKKRSMTCAWCDSGYPCGCN